VELILARFGDREKVTLADLGTGSGAIAIALAHEKPTWQITATDKSQKALDVAEGNAKSLALTNIQFVCGDWLAPLVGKKFDIIVSNPPYISAAEWPDYQAGLKYEPVIALLAEKQGLLDLEKIVRAATSYLSSNGLLILEHGFRQGEQIRELFDSSGYQGIETVCDLASQDRVTLGYY
jgi:release factor glutamine methyltransferase